MAGCPRLRHVLPGWLVLLPRRHVVALDEMATDAAAELGPLLRAANSALREVLGCQKTYVALFAEAEGFATFTLTSFPGSPAWQLTCAARSCLPCSVATPPAMYPSP